MYKNSHLHVNLKSLVVKTKIMTNMFSRCGNDEEQNVSSAVFISLDDWSKAVTYIFLESHAVYKNVEIIFDKLLSKYGDVTIELRNIFDKIKEYSNNQELNYLEAANQKLSALKNELGEKNSELTAELRKLQTKIFGMTLVDLDVYGNDLQKNETYFLDILTNVKLIEEQLKNWDEVSKGFNESNLYHNITIIPHSTASDLSFVQNDLINEDSMYVENLDQEFNQLFKKLAEIINFDDVVYAVQDLKESANEKDKEATGNILLVQDLVKKEAKTKDLEEELITLFDILKELKIILNDLNITTISEIEVLIKRNEEEIKNYSKEIVCYTQFIANCHIKKPSDSNLNLPYCMENCK